nr:hypothetical protein [Tanacetum cinerariifolium]
MANLEFCDTHNMVAYLQKPEGSEGFNQIVDFLNTHHISTLDNGEMEITATIDGKVKVVTEAYIRRPLKLVDSVGISNLPTTKIFKQLALMGVHTLGSDEGRMQHNELMDLVTKLSDRVVALETNLKQTKKVYGAAYTKLIMKVKILEKTVKTSQAKRRAKLVVSDDKEYLEDPSKQERKIDEIDRDLNISLIQHDTEQLLLPVLMSCQSAAKDKGIGIMTESEPVQTKTKLQQEQKRLGYEAAMRLQEELVRVEADEELTQRLQAEERNKYIEVDQANMLVDLINQRKRYFDAQKAEAKRNKPITQVQQRTYMSNYIKHMRSHTLHRLRRYSFDELKTLFETIMRRVNTFVPMESKVDRAVPEFAAGSLKRVAEEELDQGSSKRQNTGESSELANAPRDKDANEPSQEELQKMMIIVPKEWMHIKALQIKYPIIDWKIYTKESRMY